MRIPSFKRLIKTDYSNGPVENEQSFIEKISFSLNNGIEALYNVLNKNVSLKDNVFCTVKTINITVDSLGNPVGNASFVLDTAMNSNRVIGIQVLAAINQVNTTTYPTGAPFVSFSQNNNNIIINNITGLQANQGYQLTLVAFG